MEKGALLSPPKSQAGEGTPLPAPPTPHVQERQFGDEAVNTEEPQAGQGWAWSQGLRTPGFLSQLALGA